MPPSADVTAAQQDEARFRNQGEAYANTKVPEARGAAAAIVQKAEGYRTQTVAEANGQASRFDQVYAQYKNAPAVTRERMYLETMERVLGGAQKVIIDDPAGQGCRALPAAARTQQGGVAMRAVWNARASPSARLSCCWWCFSGTFIVKQTEQALVLRFGQPVEGRGLVTEPGLHFKYPLIEQVIDIDKRILNLESPNQEVLASDNTRIQVDAFLRYRIVDPLEFYQTVQTVRQADSQLGYIMNSAIRRVLGEANLTQIVRDDRSSLMGKIRDQVDTEAKRLGIGVVDVRIRRADLPRQISEQVFARMNSERAREAAESTAPEARSRNRRSKPKPIATSWC